MDAKATPATNITQPRSSQNHLVWKLSRTDTAEGCAIEPEGSATPLFSHDSGFGRKKQNVSIRRR